MNCNSVIQMSVCTVMWNRIYNVCKNLSFEKDERLNFNNSILEDVVNLEKCISAGNN